MPLDIVVGTQWGDEGKGHITDLIAADAHYVARFGGGDNAGHTVTIGEETFQLHLIPSGIIHPDTICVMGNGMVINPEILLGEITLLRKKNIAITPDRLKISNNAHLISAAHIALDGAIEQSKKGNAIGTTLRGIGPAYTDKSARTGLRAGILAKEEELEEIVTNHVQAKNAELERFPGAKRIDPAKIVADFKEYAHSLRSFLVDTATVLHQALEGNKSILAEGAQGTLLDLDHGTYPFVTSSWPTAGGAMVGLGVGPKAVRRIVGVAKAFTTRVGEGPFPSEIHDEIAKRLRGTGDLPWDEFGTTTGRPRRVGWLDLVILQYAKRINSLTELALTKLDILSGFKEIPVCVGYSLEGEDISDFPPDVGRLARCRPIYEVLPGWSEDIMAARELADLPDNARTYISFIADRLSLPVTYVSVGPGREQVITGMNS